MSSAYAGYIRDVVYLLREKAAEIASENQRNESPFDEGREAAYREVLAIMQNQADVFGVPKNKICLDGFDALVGAVGPPRPRPPSAD